jgi:hypothetical protein
MYAILHSVDFVGEGSATGKENEGIDASICSARKDLSAGRC